MKTHFIKFQARPLKSAREIYLNLIDEKEEVLKQISLLSQQFQEIIDDKLNLDFAQAAAPISRATPTAIQERIEEIKGCSQRFRTSQLALDYTKHELVQALEGLVLQLANAGVYLIKRGEIMISELCHLKYDECGLITQTTPDLGLSGFKALEIVAGICAQDFGLVLERQGELIYLYNSSRYEKTPKHVESGHDYFVGEKFLEWHRRIPIWGNELALLLERMYLALQQHKLDVFAIDLKGRNFYSNGEIIVQRYERDYAVPLHTLEGKIIGTIVFADVLFKNVISEIHPFFGGRHLYIESPSEFHTHFKLIKHAAFKHHPFGIRDQNGKLPVGI